jgi:hypothetical protein
MYKNKIVFQYLTLHYNIDHRITLNKRRVFFFLIVLPRNEGSTYFGALKNKYEGGYRFDYLIKTRRREDV